MDKLQLLKNSFHEDMLEIYKKAKKEEKYTPSILLKMVSEYGGYEAAKKLILTQTEGFTKFVEFGRFNLTVEYYVIKDEYKELFTDNERSICNKRLKDAGYTAK